MYRMPHMHGRMSGYGNICRCRRQMRHRPVQVHFMRHMCGGLPGWCNCPGCAIITAQANKNGASVPLLLLKYIKIGIKYRLS